MFKSMIRRLSIAAAAAILVAPLALAQPPQQPTQVRVRGTIEQVSEDALTVKQKDGTSKTVQLAPKTAVNALVKATMADIKEGVFIGTTALPKKDGSLSAVEVHIFPESMRGAGEGHYPWDLGTDSTMTNASVTHVVKKVKESTFTLKYKGGETEVTVPNKASIVSVTPGSRDDLKVGASVFSIAAQLPDGSLKTGFLLVGRGVSPPM
jgi:hypothetical protein